MADTLSDKLAQRDELISAFAEMYLGLQVPVSLHLPLGAAGPAFDRVHSLLTGFGWAADNQEVEAKIREVLGIRGGG